MRKKLILFWAFLKRQYVYFRRYLFNSLGGMLTLYVVFLLILGGYKGLVAPAGTEGDTLEALVVGYVLWFFLMTSYQDVYNTVRNESLTGTLEQLYMSTHGFGWVMGANVAAAFLANLVMVALLLTAALWTSGAVVNSDVGGLLPVLVGTLFGPVAIGFAAAGLALVFKRIDSYTQMVQFVLIALVAVPAEKAFWLRLLPGSFGASLVRDIMIRGQSLLEIGLAKLVLLFLIGIGHLALGYGVYKVCEKRAMVWGMLGHY